MLFDTLLAAITLALGIVLHDSTAVQILLFSIAGIAIMALTVHTILSGEWFWRAIARRVEPHLEEVSASTAAEELGISSPPRRAQPSDEEVARAIDDLLDELGTIHGRLTDAIDNEFYGYKFYLPSAEYEKNRHVLSSRSSEARRFLSAVYVIADNLNEKMPSGDSDGVEMALVESPDAAALRELVQEAQVKLRNIRPE